MTEMIPDIDLRINKDQRTPCVIVVDGSTTMQEFGAIDALNRGLKRLEEALKADETASTRVQVMIVRFGGAGIAEVLTEWTDAMNFEAPTVVANGNTPMGKAVDLAMTRIEERKRAYHANSTSYTRPWLFLMSDGQPNDPGWEQVAERCRQAQVDKRFVLFPVGVGEGADKRAMEMFAKDTPMIQVEAAKFEEMFLWLSASLSTVSNSTPGDQTPLPPMGAWGTVPT